MPAAMEGATYASNIIAHRKIDFVGPHVNSLPLETLEKHPEIDIAFTNEGVYALKNLLKTDLKDIGGVNGIAYLCVRFIKRLLSPQVWYLTAAEHPHSGFKCTAPLASS